MFGLQDNDIEFIINFAKKHSAIEQIGIFGSRSNGKYNNTSDIDIVLYGEKINYSILIDAQEVLEKHSPYPFYVDIKHYESIVNDVFKNEVDNNVTIIYKSSGNATCALIEG